MRRVAGRVTLGVLFAVLFISAVLLRFTGINWDQHQQVHPDERFIVWVADTISLPSSLSEAFDPARSTINPFRWPPAGDSTSADLAGKPRNFAYGHFPLYLLVIVAHAAQAVAEWFGRTTIAFPPALQPIYTVGRHLAEYDYLALVGRAISALADLGTLLCVYWLARFVVGQPVETQRRKDATVQSDPDESARITGRSTLSGVVMALPAAVQDKNDRAEHPERSGAASKGRSGLRLRPHPSTGVSPYQMLSFAPAQDASSAMQGGTIAGLLAAAMYAFAVLPIQLSHYAAVDAVLTFCVTAAVALAARFADREMLRHSIPDEPDNAILRHPSRRGRHAARQETSGCHAERGDSARSVPAMRQRSISSWKFLSGWAAWLLAGAMTGLAIGSKFSAVLLVIPLAVAAWCGRPAAPLRSQIAVAAGRFAAALGVALAVFAVTNPFAIIELRAYVGQIMMQNAMVSGVMDAPYTRQYIGTWPYLYFVQQLSQWGLGWPLGAICWGGFAWAVIRAARRQARPGLMVMLAWALPYFATTGAFHTKFLRYMAPLLPFLIVFGAGWALAGYRWLSAHWRRVGRVVWIALVGGTAIFTIAWALAFVSVYQAEHPWIAASRWIYAQIPEGARLLTEHWDDALPLTLDELPNKPATRTYQRAELALWDPDTPAKLDTLVTELSTADTIVLASNRLYAPMGRLGARYPMTSQYYRMLFAGDLGYELAAEFSGYPRLGGLTIRDDNADESFTVYDHPRVLVFENTGRLKPELLRARLGRYLPQSAGAGSNVMLNGCTTQGALRRVTSEASRPSKSDSREFQGGGSDSSALEKPESEASDQSGECPKQRGRLSASHSTGRVAGLARMRLQNPEPNTPLTLDQPVDTLPVVADFRWNRAASGSPALAVALWWLVLSIFGWLAWPLLFPLLRGLQDRGYGLARAAGWLLVGWVHWIGVSLGLWQNRLGPLVAILGLLAAAGAAAGVIQRRRLAAFIAERRRLLLGQEAIFALAFLALVGVRILNPDLWQPWNGGEKFMESAFLNAILRSAHFPPYDPYFAGGTINYYYYGLYLVSLPIKLTGIVPEVAFNLSVAVLFALTALGLFSVGYSLAAATWGRGVAVRERRNGGESSPPFTSAPLHLRTSAPVAGGLAVLFGLLMGNLRDLSWLWRNLLSWFGGRGWQPYDYWAASRVIPNTINEFPLWTFVFADLHPHLIAMPFGLLVVGLALNWMTARDQGSGIRDQESGAGEQGSGAGSQAGSLSLKDGGRWGRSLLYSLSLCLILAFSLGALGAINTWDLPTYALLVAGVFVAVGWRRAQGLGALGAALAAAAVVGLAVVAYRPFYANYLPLVGQGGGTGVGRFLDWVRASSPLSNWIKLWLVFLIISLGYVIVAWRERRAVEPAESTPGGLANDNAKTQSREGIEKSGQPGESALTASYSSEQAEDLPDAADESPAPPRSRRGFIGLLALLGVLTLLAGMGRPTAAIAALPLCLALPLVFRREDAPGKIFLALLIVMGLGVVAGTELIYLRDFLEGGDWYRMNTLFKFSVPAWLILALASSAMLPMLWAALRSASAGISDLARAAIVLLIAVSFTFLFFGVRERVDDRFPSARPVIGTLDSTAFMTVGSYTWPDASHVIWLPPEREAIQWLLDNVQGSPVVAEAPAAGYSVANQEVGYDYYRAGGLRVASLTGFPTFVGQHQYEQRPGDQVGPRVEQGKEFFSTTDIARARQLMADLHVGYVYVGQLERLLFTADALRKFDVMVELGDLETVFRNEQVTIFRVL